MRERLLNLLLDRMLPETCPDEDFFSAGPPAATRQPMDRGKRAALLVDLRRRRTSLAA
ncbi:MAG: hypothetical protein MSC30_18970 [Gaiellaceae bacterium MAG52_C11]|nr:hypothetical protein [Candidatus Gaiellasilicea maunaloa]